LWCLMCHFEETTMSSATDGSTLCSFTTIILYFWAIYQPSSAVEFPRVNCFYSLLYTERLKMPTTFDNYLINCIGVNWMEFGDVLNWSIAWVPVLPIIKTQMTWSKTVY
jgi:hypothetical protein